MAAGLLLDARVRRVRRGRVRRPQRALRLAHEQRGGLLRIVAVLRVRRVRADVRADDDARADDGGADAGAALLRDGALRRVWG